ncbi:helix-turn-helix transcriptional regulator [Tetragenococcus halophilus]|uniref:helix-turn-helix domain-containing protein n=1 Tax=Tetragenococcus halophilus TaxID=51669 RepID=UPI00102FD555
MNRIKETREEKNITQKKLAELLNVTQQAVSRYENGSRVPDEQNWEEIAQILKVPVQYLKKETDDPEGWDLWEKETGYSRKEIENEITRMKSVQHVIGDCENTQNLIAHAVANLEGFGNTDRGILKNVALSIDKLLQELNDRYEDPKKVAKLSSDSQLKIIPANTEISDLIYDDLSAEAYKKALETLTQAKRDIQNIPNELDLY